MTTLAQLTLRLARIVTDVLDGEATTGATTSLTDTVNLVQNNQYWDRGTLWILSGTHAGKVLAVTGYVSNKLSFASLGATAIAAGNRYAVARAIYPYQVLVSKLHAALDETYVIADGSPVAPTADITGDGETLSFALPAGVSRLARVEIEDTTTTPATRSPSHHWEERDGYILFQPGYAPWDEYTIHPYYRTAHTAMTLATDTLSTQINAEWLVWKAAEYVLYWGVQTYGDAKEYRIEELLNRVLAKQKGMYPRKPAMIVKTSGG